MTKTKGRARGESVNSVVWKDETFSKDDCIMVQAYNSIQPYIGQINSITKIKDNYQLEVAWFYRPEEAIGGRRPFHGEKELFRSNHVQDISLDTVMGKCQVLKLEAYEELSELDDTTYFSRFTYQPVDHRFYPDQVYVYCECQFPYNPDLVMVQCDNCEDWFHPKCVDLSQAEVEELENIPSKKFICRRQKCQATLAKRQRVAENNSAELMPGRTIQPPKPIAAHPQTHHPHDKNPQQQQIQNGQQQQAAVNGSNNASEQTAQNQAVQDEDSQLQEQQKNSANLQGKDVISIDGGKQKSQQSQQTQKQSEGGVGNENEQKEKVNQVANQVPPQTSEP